jgi:hypothetical protein
MCLTSNAYFHGNGCKKCESHPAFPVKATVAAKDQWGIEKRRTPTFACADLCSVTRDTSSDALLYSIGQKVRRLGGSDTALGNSLCIWCKDLEQFLVTSVHMLVVLIRTGAADIPLRSA